MGLPLRVVSVGPDGCAQCVDRRGDAYAAPVQTALLERTPRSGDWLLVHIDTAIAPLASMEALQIDNALQAVQRAARGESFEHLIEDLIGREPQLPPHLRSVPASGGTGAGPKPGSEPESGWGPKSGRGSGSGSTPGSTA